MIKGREVMVAGTAVLWSQGDVWYPLPLHKCSHPQWQWKLTEGKGTPQPKFFFPSEEIPFPQAITLVNISNVQPTDGKLHILQGNRNESLLLLYSH